MTMAENKEVALSIKNITKIYGKKTAADHVSFDIHRGEIFGFLGPNGAGKTTVIKSILGFIFPDEGEVVINGYNTKTHYEKAMASVGGIVENPEMYTNLSARQNIEMYARLHGNIPKSRIDEVISDNDKCMFWATMRQISKDVWSITCITIYDKVNKKTYTLFNENQEKMIVGTDRANDFQRWAFRQFDRLRDKLAA